MQATIVALYGDKQAALAALVADCQRVVAGFLGSRFRPYQPAQIHATVIGLEREESERGRFLNRNYKRLRSIDADMDFGGLLAFLRDGRHWPMSVQIGGFGERDEPFTSRGVRPFIRGFALHGDCVVMMGWPVIAAAGPGEAACYPATLETIRRSAQRWGVLHAYHARPNDTDNDLFFRIGMLDDPGSIAPGPAERLSAPVRHRLAARGPLIIDIHPSDLSVVFYRSPELPPLTTRAYSLADVRVGDAFIRDRLRLDGEAGEA
jgi:hypothetical protein